MTTSTPSHIFLFFARQAHLELAKSKRLPRRLFNTVKLGECSSVRLGGRSSVRLMQGACSIQVAKQVTYHVRIQSNLHPRVYGSIQVTCHSKGNVTVPFVAESCIWPSAAKSLCFPCIFILVGTRGIKLTRRNLNFIFRGNNFTTRVRLTQVFENRKDYYRHFLLFICEMNIGLFIGSSWTSQRFSGFASQTQTKVIRLSSTQLINSALQIKLKNLNMQTQRSKLRNWVTSLGWSHQQNNPNYNVKWVTHVVIV